LTLFLKVCILPEDGRFVRPKPLVIQIKTRKQDVVLNLVQTRIISSKLLASGAQYISETVDNNS
jgi:hypothetical protein